MLLYVCRCLETLSLICKNQPEIWNALINHPTILELNEEDDSREAVQRVTVRARIILAQLSFFASLEHAVAFASSCVRFFDNVGFAPSEAPWRRKLWTSSLLMVVSKMNEGMYVSKLLPFLMECCDVVVYGDENQQNVEAPNFSDGNVVNSSVNYHRRRREELFKNDIFLFVDFKAAFQKLWKTLVNRLGEEAMVQVAASLEQNSKQRLAKLLS